MLSVYYRPACLPAFPSFVSFPCLHVSLSVCARLVSICCFVQSVVFRGIRLLKSVLLMPVGFSPDFRATCYFLLLLEGLQNTVQLFCAAVVENRILFHSKSYALLGLMTRALLALLFPLTMRWNACSLVPRMCLIDEPSCRYPFIPILPASLVDFVSAPTPFIMGVHSSCIPSEQHLVRVSFSPQVSSVSGLFCCF